MSARLGRWAMWTYVALLTLFMLAPLFFVVVNSFNSARFSIFPPPGFSLHWYANLLGASQFLFAFKNSLIVAVASAAVAMVIGITAAMAIVRGSWRNRSLLQSLMLVPLTVPKIIIGIAVFIAAIRVSLYPSFTSLVFAHAVILLPYVISILVANLMQVQRAQEEAAMDLGANALQTFRLATVPQIRGGLLIALVFAFVLSFDEFDLSLFLTREDNMTLPIRMFLYMQELEDPTLAALSTVLIVLSAGAVALIAYLARGGNLVMNLQRRGPA
jgi:ABC-type spermidine/putrescine transport system permease subunit II